MIITADTNVLVSGVFFGGIPGRIFTAATEGAFTLALSPAILSELRQVFSRTKFGLNLDAVQILMADIESVAMIVHPRKFHSVVTDDPDDDAIIDCAVAAHADYIVSGDTHLVRLGSVEGIPVLTPKQCVEVLGLAQA